MINIIYIIIIREFIYFNFLFQTKFLKLYFMKCQKILQSKAESKTNYTKNITINKFK